jgi:hypothetical protein
MKVAGRYHSSRRRLVPPRDPLAGCSPLVWPRGSTRRAIQNLCCHCRYRTVVRDRPIFDALADAPGQPFACNLKIAMPAAGRVVGQTVVDLLARYDKANHSQRHPAGCFQLAYLFPIAHRPGKNEVNNPRVAAISPDPSVRS